MKAAAIIVCCLLSLFLGWFTLPYLMQPLSGNCRAESTLIYDEENRTVVSHAIWDIMRGSDENHINSYLAFVDAQGKETRFNVERTINVDFAYHINSITVNTIKSFRIAGPDTHDPVLGRYIDPLADDKFTARIYLFKVGDRTISGFHNRPLNSCMKLAH